MTNPVKSTVWCCVCGKAIQTVAGVQVVGTNFCDDLLCQYQGPAHLFAQREGLIVAMVLDGFKPHVVAGTFNLSRDEVLRVVNRWKQGV